MNQEVTLRDVIERAGEFIREYWRRKVWILLIVCCFGAWMTYRNFHTPVRYQAQLTYTLNDGKSAGGALNGILGSFGIGGVGKVNFEKLVSLSLSRTLIQKMLFTPVSLDSTGEKSDFIANHLLALHHFQDQWEEEQPGLQAFTFTHDSIDIFNARERWVLKKLVTEVTGSKDIRDPIFTSVADPNTGMLTLTARTVDESLSIAMVRNIYQYLEEFYVSSNMQTQQSTIRYASEKTDSVFQQLRSKEYALSRFNDSHRNLLDMQVMTERRLLEAEILKLKTMYAEATKNKELAEFSLNAGGMPDMLVVDDPMMPLDSDFQPWWLAALKGSLIGLVGMLVMLTLRKMIIEALAEKPDHLSKS